jgi:two-component system, chemotaxis family, chemotaxis protein CheY
MHNILIVDDDGAIRDVYARILSGAGFTVNSAQDGEAAWDAIEARHFDLIITDQNMPRLDGSGLIKRLHGTGRQTPVIMITGGSLQQPTRDSAPDGFLTKPFRFSSLLGEIERLLGSGVSLDLQPV